MLVMLVMLAVTAIGRSDRTSQLSSIEDNPRMAPQTKPLILVNLVESRIQLWRCSDRFDGSSVRVVEYARQGPTKPYSHGSLTD